MTFRVSIRARLTRGKKRIPREVKETRIVECMRGGCRRDQRDVRKVSLIVLCSLPREVVTADQDSEIDHDRVELRIGVQLTRRT